MSTKGKRGIKCCVSGCRNTSPNRGTGAYICDKHYSGSTRNLVERLRRWERTDALLRDALRMKGEPNGQL